MLDRYHKQRSIIQDYEKQNRQFVKALNDNSAKPEAYTKAQTAIEIIKQEWETLKTDINQRYNGVEGM